MSLNPRAVAVSGIGFGALLVAVSGLLGVTVEPEQPPIAGSSGPSLRVQQPSLRARILEEDEFIVVFLAAVTESGLLEPN